MDRRQSGVRPRGNSIQLEFSYKGVRCRETVKLNPSKANLDLVGKQKSAIEYQIATNQFDYFEHFPNSKKALQLSSKPAHHISIKDQLNSWLKVAQKRCQISTLREYTSIISNHLEPEFGHLKLVELKAGMVEEWISTLPFSNKRINDILIPLRQSFESAYLDDLIDKNPMHKVKGLKHVTREPNPFSKSEIDKILSHLDGAAKNFVQFAFWSGLRTGELIALRWQDIDEEKCLAYIRVSIVRGNEKAPKTISGIRSVALNSQAIQAIKMQKKYTYASNDRVFKDPHDHNSLLDDQRIRKKIWKPVLKAAGLEYRPPYQTRHTFASMMLMDGRSPMWVSRQMGHSSPMQTFKSYARWINENE